MKLFAMTGARRRASLNRALVLQAVEFARGNGADVDFAEFRDFEIPVYDGDDEAAAGVPEAVRRLGARIAAADGLLLSSPEYNYSIPGPLKNAIDWLSRLKPMPLTGKCALLLSASPSLVGGNRGLWALRVPLESLGVHVYPGMFSLAKAPDELAENGELRDPRRAEQLAALVAAFLKMLKAQLNGTERR